jgi:hypothetical protein
LSPGFLGAAILLAASVSSAAVAGQDDFPNGDSCAQRIRAVDDQADQDVRVANEDIARLRLELVASSTANTGDPVLEAKLAAARSSKKETLQDQHSVLNGIRAQCDLLRAAERQAARSASDSTLDR